MVGYRLYRAGFITGGSVKVNIADATKDYKLSIRINGVEVALIPLPSGSTGANSAALAAAFVVGDILTAFMVRTLGAGASAFTDMTGVVEVTM